MSEAKRITVVDGFLATATANPWTTSTPTNDEPFETFVKNTDLCRFFYKTEPVIRTVIDKLVEIGINDIIISKRGLSANEWRVFNLFKDRLLEFSTEMAQELLLSGLVVPEISYGSMEKEELAANGIKKYSKMIVPKSMWIRDPKTIKINSSIMSDSPSYFVVIPEAEREFIKNKGKYPDGKEDKKLFELLKSYYPELVTGVNNGIEEFLIPDSSMIIRRKYLPEDPYPISYLVPVLDALRHKRELRRMDFALIDKVIGAILHVKMGSDEFPMTDSDEDRGAIENLRRQLSYRFNSNQNLERIFQLITNHTIELKWVFPDVTTLLNIEKYADINQEILFGLGFPRVLITGEAERTGTSNPEISLISPIKTMESMRTKILKILKKICARMAEENKFSVPDIKFKALNLHAFNDFIAALDKLYEKSAVSRESYSNILGFDFEEELEKLQEEYIKLKEANIPDFGPTPNSRAPLQEQNPDVKQPKSTKTIKNAEQ